MLENFIAASNNNQNYNSDLESEFKGPGFKDKQQNLALPIYPKLVASVNCHQDKIIFSQEGRDFAFQVNAQIVDRLKRIILMMDGTNSLKKLQQMFSLNHPEAINTLVRYLDENKLIDDASHINIEPGLNVLLELEELTNKLLKNQDTENKLILTQAHSSNLQLNLLYGFAIEIYHFLSHKAHIDSSILSFPSCTKIQQLINHHYYKEYGQDKLLLEALNYIGISNEDIMDTMPLPETMAICNSLTYWASFDSLFYFSIIGILANQNITNLMSYIQICEEFKLDSSFIEAMRKLINSWQNSDVKNMTHQIFQEIPHIDQQTKQRFKAQAFLFVEIYNHFYSAIVNYYSYPNSLLRRVSVI